MVYRPTSEIAKSRLVQELNALGMDPVGPRAELISRLVQAGVYSINADLPPPAKMADTSCRYPNHSSVLIGNGAQADTVADDRLVICNRPRREPLIEGCFRGRSVTINNCLRLENTPGLSCDTPGQEGDMRQSDGVLYMFRRTGTHPGWYPISMGTMLLM